MLKKWSMIIAVVACAAAAAPAQAQRGGQECWNPGARHFERVRPGEVQNDLDFRRCRPVRGYRAVRKGVRECWNPRARHFEAVRPGERQNDLDFSRCRRR